MDQNGGSDDDSFARLQQGVVRDRCPVLVGRADFYKRTSVALFLSVMYVFQQIRTRSP